MLSNKKKLSKYKEKRRKICYNIIERIDEVVELKKSTKYTIFLFILALFTIKNTYAYSETNYQNKSLCGNFEVAGFHSDGGIDPVSCHANYESAKSWMKNNGADDLAIMTKIGGKTQIIDANVALLDLSVNPETLTYFYTNSELTGSSYTYMDTGSLYGGVDGIHLETAYSNAKNTWVAKVTTGNFTGWIQKSTYEIVPITWVKSSSSYTVTNDSIRHNYVAKIQNTYSGSAGSTIGPKPENINTGTYYSYDGHYFYTDRKMLIKDRKNNTYEHAVNKNEPYYNYYMYLSNHTRTSYSSINIDEYIRNSLGITQDVYGNASSNGSSRLYGKGTFFYYAQEKYGVNAILALSLSRNETGNGRSNLSINKNNGFGLNAVDSNPTQAANWYASFASSILGYASKWITYGYAHPRDWRYFGPQFGDKWIGMNVKYASDTYWSEKMAANYYSLDKAKGLQDYNYYQLGVVTRQVNARKEANNQSKLIYSYPEAEDGIVIIGEEKGETVEGNSTWYKVVSDLNIDENGNEITSGDYNWNASVYIPAAYVKKINKGKQGYISPNSVTNYQDQEYEYDLYVENTELKPRVGKTNKETVYYYDSSVQSQTGKRLLKDRYVMVYSVAYDKNHLPVSYLVTSDYKYDQKHWIKADALTLISNDYGKVTVSVAGNQYTWVNSVPEDTKATLISGQYTNSYVPVLEQKTINGYLWYKVPVDLSGTTNEFGWTLASAPGVAITLSTSIVENNAPTINASDKILTQGDKFNELEGVSAKDIEDGDLTKQIKVTNNTVKKDTVGIYEVTYEVTDSQNAKTTKTIKVEVKPNQKPEIIAEDIEIIQGRDYEEKVSAKDNEDGDLTAKVKVVENTVQKDIPGIYKIIYEVEDSYHQTTRKEIKVTVLKDEKPEIIADDKVLTKGTTFKEKEGVTAIDKEDGDLTEKIKVVKNTVETKEIGQYQVIYEVEDSYHQKTTKEIKVEVVKDQKPEIIAEDKTINLNEEFDELKGVSAIDPEDGDLTKQIKVTENTVNTKETGIYKVIYQVEDSSKNSVEKEIKVTVEEKKLQTKEGEFYLEELKWKEKEQNYTISGYLIILDEDNNAKNTKYTLILQNKQTTKEYSIPIEKWIKNTPYDLGSENEKSYSNSWFKGTVEMNEIPAGDYDLYMEAIKDDFYTRQVVNNLMNKEIDKREQSEDKNYNFKVQLSLKSKKIELNIREGNLITKSTANTFRNMVNDYDSMTFENKKLHLVGTSYNYDGTYKESNKITRKLILENTENYKQYQYDLGSTDKGSYKVNSTDGKDKSFAWYDKIIDVSNLPKGTYSMMVYTKTIDSEDYGEISDIFASITKAEEKIENKTYKITLNKERQNRIELIVE